MFLLILAFVGQIFAADGLPARELIWSTQSGKFISLPDLAMSTFPGTTYAFGENHAEAGPVAQEHLNQVRFLEELGRAWHNVSVGMEFLNYTDQDKLDRYLNGEMAEADFLREVGWSDLELFSSYRGQILATRNLGGRTYALNMPRAVTSKVAKDGPGSLNDAERALLPPVWERGSDGYFARFKEIMGGGHLPEEKIENYFWAQSLWDDTMAWNATLRAMDDEVFVIIVGGFHAEYADGLVARLKRQGTPSVRNMIQVKVEGEWSEDALRELAAPDPTHGPRADYIWFYQ